MIKIISFDMDGTLVKNLYADKVWLEGIPKLYSKEKKINLNKAKKYIFKEYDKIGKNRIEWYDIDWWFKKLKLKEDYQNILKEYSKYIKLFPEETQYFHLDTINKCAKLVANDPVMQSQ